MFRQKKLNRFLYRNVRAMSLYNTESTHRGTWKSFKVSTPQHRAHTQGNFENFQSFYTQGKIQDRAKYGSFVAILFSNLFLELIPHRKKYWCV